MLRLVCVCVCVCACVCKVVFIITDLNEISASGIDFRGYMIFIVLIKQGEPQVEPVDTDEIQNKYDLMRTGAQG